MLSYSIQEQEMLEKKKIQKEHKKKLFAKAAAFRRTYLLVNSIIFQKNKI